MVKKRPVPTKRAAVDLIKVKSCDELLRMLLVCTGWSKCLCAPDDYCIVQLMIWRWPSQNTFGMRTVLYWTRSSRTQFGVSINVWRLPGATLNIICNFLYCNHQVHRDFLITLYYCYMPKISSEIFLFWIFIFRTLCLREQGRVDSWLFFEAEWGPRAKRLGNTGIDVIMVWFTFVLGGGVRKYPTHAI